MKKMSVLIAVVVGLSWIMTFSTATCIAGEVFKPMTLKFADTVPEKSWYGEQHQWWANEVEKRTGGKLKIQIFWMEALVKWKDMLQGVQTGMADVGWVSSTYHPSNLPLLFILDNVFNFHDDYVASILALIDTLEKEPNLRAEVEREKIILVGPHISGHAQIGLKKCIDSIKDLRGKTLRTVGGAKTKYNEFLGANPVFMSFSDLYEAIDRGTISAIGDLAVNLANTFKLYEVVKCMYMQNPGGVIASGLFMNTDAFKKLPKDIQQMLMSLRKEYGIRYAQGTMDLESGLYKEWQTKYGVKLQYPSPEDKKIILEAGNKANESMIKKQESDGHAATRKVWDYYVNALKKQEDERAKKK